MVEKRDALKTWTILLAIVTFSLSLLGTFLVRSGVLTSVHAFATDPARGVFILAFLIVAVGGSLMLFAARAPALRAGGLFAPVSREGMLLLNNLLLATAAGTVLLGTLYPLFLDALTGDKVSVGPPYFNATFGPLMVPLVVAMAAGPMMRWKRGDLAGVLQRLRVALGGSLVVALGAWGFYGGGSVLAIFGMGLGAWLALGSLVYLAERIRLFSEPGASLGHLRRLPGAAWGTAVAHFGMAMLVLGITASTAWEVEKLTVMGFGGQTQVGPYTFTFLGTEEIEGPNYTATRGHFRVSRNGEFLTELAPESRSYPTSSMPTTEAAIYPMVRGDLYAVVGDPDGKGGWSARLYYKPLVSWIWAGALVMMLGGLISLGDRRHRVGAPARRRGKATEAATG